MLSPYIVPWSVWEPDFPFGDLSGFALLFLGDFCPASSALPSNSCPPSSATFQVVDVGILFVR